MAALDPTRATHPLDDGNPHALTYVLPSYEGRRARFARADRALEAAEVSRIRTARSVRRVAGELSTLAHTTSARTFGPRRGLHVLAVAADCRHRARVLGGASLAIPRLMADASWWRTPPALRAGTPRPERTERYADERAAAIAAEAQLGRAYALESMHATRMLRERRHHERRVGAAA